MHLFSVEFPHDNLQMLNPSFTCRSVSLATMYCMTGQNLIVFADCSIYSIDGILFGISEALYYNGIM